MTTNIYILKLEGGKFYVGKTENPMKRYQEHLNGSGSAWTKLYKPIGIEKVIENASPFDEDRYVKEYMFKHGIENVRGGAYVTLSLPEFQEEALKSELWGASDKCTTCGRKGHWAKNCYARTDVSGNDIVYESETESESESEEEVISCADCNKEFRTDYQFEKHTCRPSYFNKKQGACYRCGHFGHYASQCYAKIYKN
jgi:predicted GIY-YIG superfamily endonuclease